MEGILKNKEFLSGEIDTSGRGIISGFNDNSNYNLLIGNPSAETTVSIEWRTFGNYLSTPVKNILYRIERKEALYITAVKNLRKKINFISLNNEFQNGDISDEDFENEIESNPDKYVVNVEEIKNLIDLEMIYEVVDKIQEDFTIDEIAEVFSIDITRMAKIEKVN